MNANGPMKLTHFNSPPLPGRAAYPNYVLASAGLGWVCTLEAILFAYRRGLLSHGWIRHVGIFVGVHFTPLIWCGYLLVLLGLLGFAAHCVFAARWRFRLLALSLWSVIAWCYFDWLNFRFMRNSATGLHAWEYQGLPPAAADRAIGYFIAFAAIAPALFLTAELLRRAGLWRLNSAGIRIAPAFQIAAFLLGVCFFAGPFILHDPIANFMIWCSLIFMLDPVNFWLGRPSLIADWRAGRWGRTLALMLGGLACGLLWEFWNYWAIARWTYHLPFLAGWKHVHYFAMPLPGLIGYLGFGPQMWVMWQFSLLFCRKLVEGETSALPADAELHNHMCL